MELSIHEFEYMVSSYIAVCSLSIASEDGGRFEVS